MSDQHKPDENPLEDAAAAMSEGLTGTSVEVEQASKRHIEGGQVHMTDSAAKSVSASALHMEDSAALVVHSGSVDVNEGAIGVSISSNAMLNNSTTGVVVSRNVKASDVRSMMLIAGKVDGDVETVFTPLTALAAGAGLAFGLVSITSLFTWLLVRPIRRLRSRSKAQS
jgi:hypothetical protein